MDWTQVLAIILGNFAMLGANLGIFFWLRAEANADRRQIQQESAADRRDFLSLIREIKDELKDFHARLCVIEEKRSKK
jgi:predicted aminopeptidase